MTVITKSGHKVVISVDGQVVTRETERGLVVEIRDMEGKTLGFFLNPQAIIP